MCNCAFKLDILIHLSSEVLTGFLFSLHLWDLIYKFIITPIIKKDFQYTSKNLTCTLCTTKGIHQYPVPQYTPKVSMSSLLSPSFMEGKSQRGYSDNVLMKWRSMGIVSNFAGVINFIVFYHNHNHKEKVVNYIVIIEL